MYGKGSKDVYGREWNNLKMGRDEGEAVKGDAE